MPQQYLARYAEPEARAALKLVTGCTPWQQALTLPALDEEPEFVFRLAQRTERVLIVLVINQTRSPITPANQALISAIEQRYPELQRCDNLALFNLGSANLLLVDRAHTPLPPKTGVGLARKIGADIALQLIDAGLITSPWIYCTDADTQLPEDYFYLSAHSDAVAASLPFTHIGPPGALLDATLLYEQAIRYYACGLRFAGSEYGFLALGSALAVKAQPYAQVRGFNQREAGEDFYLLNKLAKLGRIETPETSPQQRSPLRISARFSNRTPFGTGPSVVHICQLASLNDYLYYAPDCFLTLKHWFDLVPRLTQHNLTEEVANLPEPLKYALIAQNIASLSDHIARQGKTPSHIKTICHTWLDGFRTLKIIHHLQSHAFPAIPLVKSLKQQPFY
jgi:hypothetical protein